jgi:hypothetical protein
MADQSASLVGALAWRKLFDRVQIGAVRRQEQEPCAGRLNGLATRASPPGRKLVPMSPSFLSAQNMTGSTSSS